MYKEKQGDSDIAICFAADENYAQHATVAMQSILSHSKYPERLRFFLIEDNISEDTKNKIRLTFADLPQKISFVSAGQIETQKFYVSGQISKTAYVRIFLSELLPENIDRVIYLDCDLICFKDIEQLWLTDLKDNPVGAVMDLGIMTSLKRRKEKLNTIGVDVQKGYFNSGVLLIDLKKWRSFNYSSELLNLIINHEYSHHDQDALNAVFKDCWTVIPMQWNVIPPVYNLYLKILKSKRYRDMAIDARKNMAILHYAGGYKPWEYKIYEGFNEMYYEMLSRTAFRHDAMPQLDMRRKHRSIQRQMARIYLADFWQKIFT